MNSLGTHASRFRKGRGIALLLSLLMLLAACGNGEGVVDEPAEAPDEEPAAEPEEAGDELLQLDYVTINNTYHTPTFVAAEMGYWLEEGLDVNLMVVTSGRDVTTALGAGEADLGGANMGTTTASARAGGNLLSGVVPYSNSATHIAFAGGRGLVANAESGIVADDPETWRGTTWGVLEGSTNDIITRRLIENNGLDPATDLEMLNVPVPDMSISMQQGLVDAVSAWEPYMSQIVRELGDNAVIIDRNHEGYVADVIGVLAHEDWIPENEELLYPFVVGIVRAMQFVRENPEEAAQITASYIDGLNIEDATEGFRQLGYDPRISICTREGLVATAQGMVDEGTIEVDEPFVTDDIVNTTVLDRVIEDHPEYLDGLPPLPETLEDCEGQLN